MHSKSAILATCVEHGFGPAGLIRIASGRFSPLRGALRASKTLARFDSGHPWPSPLLRSGRAAVQIGCPADLCRTWVLILGPLRQDTIKGSSGLSICPGGAMSPLRRILRPLRSGDSGGQRCYRYQQVTATDGYSVDEHVQTPPISSRHHQLCRMLSMTPVDMPTTRPSYRINQPA
jgi:hypothetical protein